ncbi:MAG: SGNH/GDSL hydrolase family protein, partial [Lentisphaerae bacterium]|nr:SGNH/GDSL hydrolase family protein [Lentisphaerota bacterium]
MMILRNAVRFVRVTVVVLLVVFGTMLPTTARSSYSSFNVVGDSISAGYNSGGYVFGDGWVSLLFGDSITGIGARADTIDTIWPGIETRNNAVPGSTAGEWASPVYLPTVDLLSRRPDLVVVFIGGNDLIDYMKNDGVLSEAEKDAYRLNLRTIMDSLTGLEPVPEIVLVGYYDLFDGLSENLPAPMASYRGFSSGTLQGNAIIEQVAGEYGCLFVDLHTPFMHHCYGADLGDPLSASPSFVRTPLALFDIHPNSAGHQRIYETVYQLLSNLSPSSHTLTAAEGGGKGSVSPEGCTVSAGANQVFTATPGPGYDVATWLLDGAVTQNGGMTFSLQNIQASHEITVVFEAIEYLVTAQTSTGGRVTPTEVTMTVETEQTFTAVADEHYTVDKWEVDGAAVQDGGVQYAFSGATGDHVVRVTFLVPDADADGMPDWWEDQYGDLQPGADSDGDSI